MKLLGMMMVMIVGGLLIYASEDMPGWGDPGAPASTHVSPRYIEKSEAETSVPNMVTAILADYRGYDTLGETAVIFTAAVCCVLLLRRYRK